MHDGRVRRRRRRRSASMCCIVDGGRCAQAARSSQGPTARTNCLYARFSLWRTLRLCVCDGAQVRSSKALKQVIEYALAIGNYLNGGTNKGGAWGFKIESLNKLIGTKTLDNKSTRARWRLLAC